MVLKEPLLGSPKGGFRTMPFILANEAFEKVASFGLMPNMIMYLMTEYRMEMTAASNILFLWGAATNLTPVIGAFLADSCVGRFWMVGAGSIISLLGMILLWLTAVIPQARPPPCNQNSSHSCESPTILQTFLLGSSFCLMSIGAGGVRSSSLAFGADQLDAKGDMRKKGMLESFFNWYYASAAFSVVVAMTCIVYIQDNVGWQVGFGIPALLMFFSAFSFFLASPIYVKLKASTSLATELIQVIVASYRNRHIPSQSKNMSYHQKKGSLLLEPSSKLRFLNKACIIGDPLEDLTADGRAADPWGLCTVDQVEELKALITVVPLWSTGMLMSVNFSQGPFSLLLTQSMNRHITTNFEIPAGSFGIFTIVFLTSWICLYDRIILPLASKIKGRPVILGVKKKMGIGILFSCMSMAASALIEFFRRKTAIREGYSDDPHAAIDMSAMWLLAHHLLSGLAEAFNAVGQNEFYYSELPNRMSSIASTLLGVGMCIASMVSSLIMNTVDHVTRLGGKESWISSNINKAHFDYYYWLLAGLSVGNLIYFLVCSRAYGPCAREVNKLADEENEMLD